jgi:hypothetical protein
MIPSSSNSLSQNLSREETEPTPPAKDAAGAVPSGAGWMDRYLPPRGFERVAFLILALLVVSLKVLAIYHYRSDSDETQHAHVVWSWVTGRLQYRDVFDNHMPLFQMLCAPAMAMLGQRPDIMIMLRWVLLPLYFVSVWCVYRLTDITYGRRLAPWFALLGATLGKFFYTSTEFRTDQLWTAFWLLGLVVALSGRFTLKRALGFGLLLGLGLAVSVKTVPLIMALVTATAPALALAWWRGVRTDPGQAMAKLVVMGLGAAIPPLVTIGYFVWRGAFWIMFYCVIQHNLVPGLKRWGRFSLHQWYYPDSIVVLAAFAWLIFRQTPDPRLAIRRVLVLLTPWFYLFLLLSYWPDITREDDLPYIPLVPLSIIPLAFAAGTMIRSQELRRKLLTYGLPGLALINFFVTFRTHNLIRDRMAITTHNLADVLLLTKPDDYVMDTKGDYVFRPRPYYWVLEPLTKARVRMGTINDNIERRMIESGTKLCFLDCTRDGSLTSQFIKANYMPFDPWTRDMGVLGKIIGKKPDGGAFQFEITIPQTYAVVTETGKVEGTLDGKPYTGPVWLTAGKHEFDRTAGNGRVAVFWNDAYQKGFLPLFDADETLLKADAKWAREIGKPELQ